MTNRYIYLCCGCLHDNWLSKCHACFIRAPPVQIQIQMHVNNFCWNINKKTKQKNMACHDESLYLFVLWMPA